MKRRISLLLAVVMLLALGLTACGGDTSSSTGGGASTATSGGTSPSTGGTTAPAKDTLVIGHWSDPPTLDPNNALHDCSMRITTNVYDTLIRMDKDFQPQPCLAESWEVSDDGYEYTFKIREGVKFHDGSTLTADDVVWSIERGMASPKASPAYSKVESVTKVDDQHVMIRATAPSNSILANLALPFGPIMSKAYTESMSEEEFGRNPMGTGPYKFVSWTTGERVVIEANDDYFMGAPSIRRVEYVAIADTAAALISLESGDIDAYCDIATSDYEIAKANANITINEGAALGYEFLQFNTSKAPFDDVRVRQAMAYAFDKEAMLIGINDDIGTVIDTVVLDTAIGYTDDIQKYEYNLDTARQLLADAGYADGFSCDIHVNMDIYAKYAQVFQANLSEIGVTANIIREESSAYKTTTLNGAYDMAINGCSFTTMDVYEAVGDSLMGDLIGVSNSTFYNNPRVTELFEESKYTVDQDELVAIYSEILVTISEEVPIVPFIWRVRNVTANKDLNIPFIDPYAFHYLYDWNWTA